ncbi:hypothetical protein AQUCO_08400014v1 [Aquilegia coerulea]|uniref:Uncharacterized protein n=1 Tax=Aquilegia coerulea TaxID=218851 RepID=A0A2G5C6Q9_AQUCA|nr:hypothetical protein AQUCO_08400014v1 [Aquilegia coerulea]
MTAYITAKIIQNTRNFQNMHDTYQKHLLVEASQYILQIFTPPIPPLIFTPPPLPALFELSTFSLFEAAVLLLFEVLFPFKALPLPSLLSLMLEQSEKVALQQDPSSHFSCIFYNIMKITFKHVRYHPFKNTI